ncbi:hypothetical protein I4Q36_01180 [Tuanshanicoccus lijuaniae]|nr:hypothetical protein [Aerococcaceae bacterium zg-1292]QQA37357.1 hypothetical protein I4Q36_01180 [Aerococcaceae bacterium zg-1292]
MNQEVLLQMMRVTIPRDRALLEAFLFHCVRKLTILLIKIEHLKKIL